MDMILIVALMLAMIYFFMIRPESKRKKEAQTLRDSLTVGDNITTIGGMTGTICKVDENTVVFETGADRVRIEVTKWAISNKEQPIGEQTAKSAKDGKPAKEAKEQPKELKEAEAAKDAKEQEK